MRVESAQVVLQRRGSSGDDVSNEGRKCEKAPHPSQDAAPPGGRVERGDELGAGRDGTRESSDVTGWAGAEPVIRVDAHESRGW